MPVRGLREMRGRKRESVGECSSELVKSLSTLSSAHSHSLEAAQEAGFRRSRENQSGRLGARA